MSIVPIIIFLFVTCGSTWKVCDSGEKYCGEEASADLDGDGYANEVYAGNDCDDLDASVYPGASVVCDTVRDRDCDGAPDLGPCDADADGFTVDAGDCDDYDVAVYPGAPERCFDEPGLKDNDCAGDEDADDPDCAASDTGDTAF